MVVIIYIGVVDVLVVIVLVWDMVDGWVLVVGDC